MITWPLWRLFYRDNPLATFEPDSDDMQGWNSDSPVFEAVLRTLHPRLIVEVGSWKGASAIHMAKLAPEAQILCIDTWLGSPEMMDHHNPISDDLRRVHGWAQLYYTFASNVVRHVGRERICPLALPSTVAAHLLRRLPSFQADVVYIDGSHEYADVARDLDDYWPFVRPGGFLIVDDYHFADVHRAVDERFPQARGVYEKCVVQRA